MANFVEQSALEINQQINGSTQQKDSIFGNEFLYRCRGCNNNLASNTPASQYQKQKLIQNTVRVPSSIYTMNLGALNVYQRPNTTFEPVFVNGTPYITSPGVNWNQMSDRREPHVQKTVTGGGSTYHSSSIKRTQTALRPGALSPGGQGVDIKHNSYDRYLARIKGKAPLRRGVIPPFFGRPYIPFNRAFPVYGGKVFKTSIVNNCNCPIVDGPDTKEILYKGGIQDEIYNVKHIYSIGDEVYTFKANSKSLYKAIITKIINNLAVVQFVDDKTLQIGPLNRLIVYTSKPACINICDVKYLATA